MRHSLPIAAICSILSFFACTTTQKTATTGSTKQAKNGLTTLVELMAGKYNSAEQAKKDTDYFNISLVMQPIWADRTDGKWLYVEQAMATKLEKPYRQRVYQLEDVGNGVFTSKIYTLKNEKDFINAQDDAKKMASMTFDKIELKDGCTVTLHEKNGVYTGGTDLDKCPSALRGAKYATTKINLKAGEMVSWDQGFNASGKQVWGATKAGYIFKKLK